MGARASTVPPWWLRGSLVSECSCDWGCPCNFDAKPTKGHCDGFYTIVVGEGRFGEVVLDGVTFIFGGHSPGAIHEGNGTSILVVDEGATQDQRSAVETLWRGGGVGMPFDAFAMFTTTWLDPVIAPIDVDLRGIRSSVRVAEGSVYDLSISRIRNPVTGEEEEIYLDKPTGFTSLRSEMGMAERAIFRSPRLTTDNTGQYAEFAEFEYSGP